MSVPLLAPLVLVPLRVAASLAVLPLLALRPLADPAARAIGDVPRPARRRRPVDAGPASAGVPVESLPSAPAVDPGEELERRIRAAAAELPAPRRAVEGERVASAPPPAAAPLPVRRRPAAPAAIAVAASGAGVAPPPPAQWADQVRRYLAHEADPLGEARDEVERLVGRRNSAAYRAAAVVLGRVRDALVAAGRGDELAAYVADLRARHPRKRALHAVLDERGFGIA